MQQLPKRDYQTTSFFLILALLTAMLVLGFRWWNSDPINESPAVIEAIRH